MTNIKVLDQDHGKMWYIYHGDCVDVARGIPESKRGLHHLLAAL